MGRCSETNYSLYLGITEHSIGGQQRYPEQRGLNLIAERKNKDDDSHQQRMHIVTELVIAGSSESRENI